MESTVTDPLVGRRLGGRYHLTALVARGGMATVYTAKDERLRRTVAVKVMHRALAEDPNFVRRFVREARAAATLSHPGVVAVFDQGEDAGLVYLVMEYVQGRTLRDELAAAHAGQVAMPPQRALLILDQVLAALATAHDAGLVHLDIKPENVLLRPDGQAKVADFGLARAISSSGTNSGSTLAAATASRGLLMGTIAYLSPEQVTHGIADTRSDVYAAGIMAYELLTGVKPHTGDSPIQIAYQHVNTDVPAPSDRVPSLPPYVDGLVLTATARDRMGRPADARAFLEQLRRVRTAFEQGIDDPELTADLSRARQAAATPQHTLVAPPDLGTAAQGQAATPLPASDGETTPTPPAAPPSRKRRLLLIGLATALVLALVGGGAWYVAVARYTELPNLQTLTESEAKAKLASLDLEYEVEDRVYRERFARGQIVSSQPKQGSRVLKGSTVAVLVSRGPERFVMPTLQGATEQAARTLVEKTHLKVGKVKREFSETVAKGKVISASPDPGTQLRRGTEIGFTVSKGREPIKVPQVVGKSGDEADRMIRDAQLSPTRTEEFSDTVPGGQVIKQAPANGTLFRGDKVTITVSKGQELIDVPSVANMPLADARKALSDAGLVPEEKKGHFYSGLDLVIGQSPDSGKVPKGSKVTLELI